MSDYRSIYEEIDRSKGLAPMPLGNINEEIYPGTFVRIEGPSISGLASRKGEVVEVAGLDKGVVFTVPPDDLNAPLAYPIEHVTPVPRPEDHRDDPSLVTGVGFFQLVKALLLARRHLRKSTELGVPQDKQSIEQRDRDIETIDTVIKHHPLELKRSKP